MFGDFWLPSKVAPVVSLFSPILFLYDLIPPPTQLLGHYTTQGRKSKAYMTEKLLVY